ncbi:MAG: hypothetical protein RQ723_07805 [Desulfuromonadales bacterium]|nr:hypothetical protein [Desulfuromonadales bacterium]
MRVWQRCVLGMLWVPLVLTLALPAQAATVTGRASTVLEWYDTAEEETAIPLHQYLQFSLLDLGNQGYNFKVYGRLSDDLADEVDVDSRLYYAYLEKKGVVDGLDFRLGRQFISTTAGASLMDGLRLDYGFAKNYSLTVYGGGDVTYYSGYNAKDVVWGVEGGGRFLDDALEVNLSYLQKLQDGRLDIELIGFDASYDWQGRLWLYSETQWDYLSDRLSYQLLGGKYRFDGPYTLRLEYLYSLPVFSANSIYSVFAVEEYEEVMAEVTWTIRRGLQAFGRYTHEIYDEFDDASVFEFGLEKLRTVNCSGYVSGVVRRDDDGQNLHGMKAYGNYRFTPKISAGLGLSVDVLEREIAFFHSDDTDQDETTSTRLWADARYSFTKKVNVEAKYEYIESDLWDHYNRGRVRLNILF